jgi:ubiquinone/menaquinone biosynthesis C-methylase UbiE
MSEHSQSSLFLGGEGDAWYMRNSENLYTASDSPDVGFISSTLNAFQNSNSTILEIGCGGGAKLSALSEYFDSLGYGIDPSKRAIRSAREKYSQTQSKLHFETGIATNLPYEDNQFDLVFFGFCLYLVPPNEILSAAMEADRVLRQGGFLAILDFDYGQQKVNSYKHADGVYSFKNSYSKLFTSLGYFHQVSKWSFSHSDNSFAVDKDERISVEVLYKELI